MISGRVPTTVRTFNFFIFLIFRVVHGGPQSITEESQSNTEEKTYAILSYTISYSEVHRVSQWNHRITQRKNTFPILCYSIFYSEIHCVILFLILCVTSVSYTHLTLP